MHSNRQQASKKLFRRATWNVLSTSAASLRLITREYNSIRSEFRANTELPTITVRDAQQLIDNIQVPDVEHVTNLNGDKIDGLYQLAGWTDKRPRVAEYRTWAETSSDGVTIRCEGITEKYERWLDIAIRHTRYDYGIQNNAIEPHKNESHLQYIVTMDTQETEEAFIETAAELADDADTDTEQNCYEHMVYVLENKAAIQPQDPDLLLVEVTDDGHFTD